MDKHGQPDDATFRRLAAGGYWPAQAALALDEGRLSSAVRICKEYLPEQPGSVSGRMVYATALFRSGQMDSAAEELRRVLARDPDHLVALKLLGDIRFATGDVPAALADYRRVLEIDPYCRGLASRLRRPERPTTRTITIARGPAKESGISHEIPFVTETMGDLYLAQGHHRLAGEVYRRLLQGNSNPRLAEKLSRIESGAGKSSTNETAGGHSRVNANSGKDEHESTASSSVRNSSDHDDT